MQEYKSMQRKTNVIKNILNNTRYCFIADILNVQRGYLSRSFMSEYILI